MEYGTVDQTENDNLIRILRSLQAEDTSESIEMVTYGSINNIPESTTFLKTISLSFWTSFTITTAAIPVASLMVVVLQFDMNTSDRCFQHIQHNRTLPRDVMKWVLAGHVVEVMTLHFWFQLQLALTFTWKGFMTLHRNTLWIALFQGIVVSAYKIVLFSQHVNFTLDRYRYFGNIVFWLGVISTGFVVSKKICVGHQGMKKFKVFTQITSQYFIGCIVVLLLRYLAIPSFINEENEIVKAIIAVVVHLPIITLNIINEKVALSSLRLVTPGRRFLFANATTGVSTLMFRIMQADFKNIYIFISLSVYRGTIQIILTATKNLRRRILLAFEKYFKVYCHEILENQKEKERYRIRFNADSFIQSLLFQDTALIVSQAYQALYNLNNFYIKPWEVFAESLTRVAIGSGINFVTNSVSIFIYARWFNSALPKAWSQAWLLHLTAVLLSSVMTIAYCSVVLLTVFQEPEQGLVVRNCTAPF